MTGVWPAQGWKLQWEGGSESSDLHFEEMPLPLATTWKMFTLSEIGQAHKDKYGRSHFNVASEEKMEAELIVQESRIMAARGWSEGKGEILQRKKSRMVVARVREEGVMGS